MTAHNLSVGFGVDHRACAVIDRAYSEEKHTYSLLQLFDLAEWCTLLVGATPIQRFNPV